MKVVSQSFLIISEKIDTHKGEIFRKAGSCAFLVIETVLTGEGDGICPIRGLSGQAKAIQHGHSSKWLLYIFSLNGNEVSYSKQNF